MLAWVAQGSHYDPHSVLGQHLITVEGSTDQVTIIRTRRPLASEVIAVLSSKARIELAHAGHGIWEGAHTLGLQDYTIETRYPDGSEWVAEDGYRFAPTVGELDLHLIREGRHERLWEVLGARYIGHGGVKGTVQGTAFSVWAPNAQAVRVKGTFNNWNGDGHSMRSLGSSGVWELFVPDVHPGEVYKFEILTKAGHWVERADPMARQTECPPLTGSIIAHSTYNWGDKKWLTKRAKTAQHAAPMSIYELHVGSWRQGLSYRQLADDLIGHVLETGFTHVEFMPLAEHPYGPSWGYQVTGYYAPTARFGDPDDLKYLIDRLHDAGIGVILDWVPGHFPKDEWALARFDGQPLYEHADPRKGEHPDWGTYIFDFGRNEVRNFLVANALYWIEEFHIDGLRVDAVASMLYLDYSREDGQWLPNQYGGRENLEAINFLQEANATVYKHHPGVIMAAEESTSWGGVTAPTEGGGLGFGFKWNMGWMHDSLEYIHTDPMYREYHHWDITFSFQYAFSENFILPISHDEVVHGKGSLLAKMPGDHWQKLANMRAYLAFMWGHPGKQLLFMGQEFGQPSEWSQERSLDWWILDQPAHQGLQRMVKQLNSVYQDTPALWQRDSDPEAFQWIDGADNGRNVVSFLRYDAKGNALAVVANFAGNPHHDFQLGLPSGGVWAELFNSDAQDFGGSGVGNMGKVTATRDQWGSFEHSARISLPPLGVLFFYKPAK
ncbi:1,4-alpha-glucan branching protein GlgB [Aurantimicrobium sp. MWH-Uga1]|uniref:1,4-alpha-glucan branching protein GlgB n=1 Tax=Aurantimicrobium sp. MWH-Uga1 TaxID=2079575 RepID=UPI003529DE9A